MRAASNTNSRFAVFGRVLSLALLFLTAFTLQAQIAGTGSIQGTVSDATGAVLPNAAVTITEIGTQAVHTVKSDSGGIYSFPNISIGTYTLSVTAEGFQTYVQSNIVLEVGSSISVNLKMSVGSTTEKVEVHAEGIALQTEDASFKQTVDSKTVTEMPLNGRHMTDLITLSGAATAAPGNDMTGSKSFPTSVSISIAGGAGNETTYRLDGGDNMDYMTNVNLPFPFPDAVNQFSVESTVLGANGGEHPGGLVNVVTRSGTNQLHQDEIGGTIGGPIKRDKLFAFFGYQHYRSSAQTNAKTAYVPSAANLLGDFSVTDSSACVTKGPYQLVNPHTGALLAGNKIDPKTFDPAAVALAKYLPTAQADQCGQVQYSVPSLSTENQYITREDWTINSKHTFYGRYLLDDYVIPAYFQPTDILVTTSAGNNERAQSLTLGETWAISSHLVNSIHVTGMRRRNDRGPAVGINANTVGVNIYAPNHDGIQTSVTSKWSAYCGTCAPAKFNDNTFAFNDDVNLVLGKHQLVFGGEFVRNQLNISNQYQTNGTYSFSGQFSQYGPSGSAGSIAKGATGIDANLDFLTGSMSALGQSKTQQNALRGSIPSIYVQDTYHPTGRLSVTAGVRWIPEFEPVDYFNRGAVFDQAAFLANQVSTVFPGAPAGVFFYGDKGVSREFMRNHPLQFSPNLGLAFDPSGNGKTVFRAGGELAYDQPNFFTAQRVNQNPPFATATQAIPVGAPISFSNPYSAGSSIPVNPYPQPFKPAANTVFPDAAQYIVVDPNFHPQYTIQYTASMQHQLGRSWQFQMDYIGNRSNHAQLGLAINPAVYIPGVWTGPGSCGGLATSPGIGKPCSTTGNQSARFALTLANPTQGPKLSGGGGGSNYITSGGNATYNGLVTTIQHRASSGFSFLANYTWSKCLNIEDAQGDVAGTTVENPQNIRMDYGPCGSDVRHVFNTTLVATSNFGLEGWKSALINHWEIAPLLHIQSGTPFTVVAGQDIALTAVGHDRPNLTNPHNAGGAYTHQKLTQTAAGNRSYLDPSAFTQVVASGTYGNVSRNQFFGPKRVQFDAEISRLFPIRERVNLDFRLEAFNVLNHPNFNNPNATLNSSTFGQITSAGSARIFQGAFKVLF
jgi:hypothetical protein